MKADFYADIKAKFKELEELDAEAEADFSSVRNPRQRPCLTKEAEEDGVILDEHGRCLIPCEICGRKIVVRTEYSRKRQYICDHCKAEIKTRSLEKTKKIDDKINVDKYETRFNKAIARLTEQVGDISPYQSAINTAHTVVARFGSIPEVLAAIELLKNHIPIIPQQRIGKYTVDFCIPKYKTILEVDGGLYHQDISKEGDRDFYLHRHLGFDWIIIHYPAEIISKDVTRLVGDIKTRLASEALP